ncbi:zinc-dependent peptidase [Pseudomonas sp. gcc21]|uniref:M90 family metallopeptidase n=1 Tax=Pseudomonas sp. gcc21 TaxID=2726989 RepID=UPI001452A2CF|nr:M90 family metallopeptidase [Pseudomonas sp. gcc21]QJD60877.1 zinc-dependent peptidase [Pseudomonas sp. gcc21]
MKSAQRPPPRVWRRLGTWREDRQLRRLSISAGDWQRALGDWSVYRRYSELERCWLHEAALRLLLRKHFVGVDGLEISDAIRLRIAGMAVVPVLGLGLDWYDGWQTLILYDGPFVANHSWQDEYGIVHQETSERSGEAWEHGPIVLSLRDVLDADQHDGYNVVIHELAHTLDMRSASANGAPPLHSGMDAVAWKRDLSAAWDDLARRAELGERLPVDSYALEDPAEFFAVLSETFFESPRSLQSAWPAVYGHLVAFYRQDPLALT